MSGGWFIRLELCEPVADENLEEVRSMLLDTLAAAGFRARSTTAEWALVELTRRPVESFQVARPQGAIRQVRIGRSHT